jgi:acylpyruvate hydrolase
VRVATLRTAPGGTRAARLDGEELVLLPFADVRERLASGEDWAARARAADGERVAVADADFAPVVPRPEKIFGIGLNYAAHAAEANLPIPENPPAFAMFWRCLLGPNDPIVMPANSDMVDWEAELGVVVGRAVRHAGLEEAEAAIAGYTIVNDVSMRDWQRRTSQFLQGKTFEASTPAGPYLVTPDEVDGARDLRITCTVDGEVMQDARTSDLVHSPAKCVAYLSQVITLVPGDLIATGTPGGVGGGRRPQIYLREGQVVRTAIEGLGAQENACVGVPTGART